MVKKKHICEDKNYYEPILQAMQIDKILKGEKFRYQVQFIPNTMTAMVKWMRSDEGEICKISDDFMYILLPDNFTQFISGIGRVKVGKLKMDRRAQNEAKDYNDQLIYIKQ